MADWVSSGTIYFRAYILARGDFDPNGWLLALRRVGARSLAFYSATPSRTVILADDRFSGRLSMVGLPRDRYVCVQVAFTFGDPNGSVEVRYDGVLSLVENPPVRGTVQGFAIGTLYPFPPGVNRGDALFDEVVIDTSPIPCD